MFHPEGKASLTSASPKPDGERGHVFLWFGGSGGLCRDPAALRGQMGTAPSGDTLPACVSTPLSALRAPHGAGSPPLGPNPHLQGCGQFCGPVIQGAAHVVSPWPPEGARPAGVWWPSVAGGDLQQCPQLGHSPGSRCLFSPPGTSSADVKENRNVSNLEARLPPSGDRARGGAPGLKRKRPLEEGNGGHLCQLRLLWRRLAWSVAPKNALVQLHELRPGLQFRTVSQTGPVHAPVFAVAVDVNGLTFEGTGPTKKKAKMRAAELALRSFVQLPNACQAHPAPGGTAPDFTSDQADFPDSLFQRFEPTAPSEGFPGRRPAAPERLATACRRGRLLGHPLDLDLDLDLGGPTAPGARNPVVLLNELRSGLRYVCLSEPEKRRAQSFVMAVSVDGRTFEGSGRSKKLAKGQAAQAALQALFDIRLPGHVPSRSKSHLLPQVRALR